jgi:long-chain acyl-CoA synthetase
VQELSVPSTGETPPMTNVADYAYANAADYPSRVAVRKRQQTGWRDVTFAQFADEVTLAARGLIASGIARGDRVAIMARTCYEWTLLDFALFALGAVVVPIYETSSAEQVAWILGDSGAKAIVVETAEHEATVAAIRDQIPDLHQVWQLDGGAIAELADAAAQVPAEAVAERRTATRLDDLASLIYTSGTTGRPKGCELIHGNFVTEVTELTAALDQLFIEGTSTLLFIPAAHVFGRVIQIGAIARGCVLGHTADIKNLVGELGTFQPTFVLSVPRVFEKVYNTAKQRAHADRKGRIFDAAERVAIRYSTALADGSVPLSLRLQHAMFDRLVYRKLRAALGGRCTAAVSGGAPLGARLGHFFRGVGVTVYEGYGLTETTAGVCVNAIDAIRIGTVGRPAGGVSIRIADDGELLVRSDLVFRGYWQNEAATKGAIDPDGWFHTGDLGSIDGDGFVSITGRKKEIIVTASGKNVAPAVLEDRVRAHWLVSQCLVVGDRQPFVAALVTIDPDAFPTWLAAHGRSRSTAVADVVRDADLHATVQEAIDEANRAVSKAESIRKFAILPSDWTEATGDLTPSLKLKRGQVATACAAQITALYADERVGQSA